MELKKYTVKEVHEIFPLVTFDELDSDVRNQYYNVINISIFDHWLDRNEAKELINPALKYGSPLSIKYETIFREFYDLFLNYSKFEYVELNYDDKRQDYNYQLLSINEKRFTEISKKSFKEISLMVVAMPEIGLLLAGGFDFTNTLFVNKKFSLKLVNEIINESKLFILP